MHGCIRVDTLCRTANARVASVRGTITIQLCMGGRENAYVVLLLFSCCKLAAASRSALTCSCWGAAAAPYQARMNTMKRYQKQLSSELAV